MIHCASVNLCRCGHFLMSHIRETGVCIGRADMDDWSIRCECSGFVLQLPVSCSQCGGEFIIPGRDDGFSHCDDHTEWEPEDE